MEKKPWGGRFSKSTDKRVEAFTASIDFDKRLYSYDINGSIAHCKMLAKCKIIKQEDADKIVKGLQTIKTEIEAGSFKFKDEYEDIHMNIEKRLIELVGSVGGKLHTARSRNDQVALDVRMYLKDEVVAIVRAVNVLKKEIVNFAESNIDVQMPGYTHLQKAQPVLFAHHILAYHEMFDRDAGRFEDVYKRLNVMPLGAAAMAGTNFPIDRDFVAKGLSFPSVTENSIDTVSDRDFAIETCSASSILMMHLSRMCEEFILWSSSEFKFIFIDDAFCTGSSIMPQKKNPDICELVRGKTGRVYGNLMNLLTIMKSLPLAYNRDMQEDKEPLFDTVDTVRACVEIIAELLKNIKVNKNRLSDVVKSDFLTATDIADYLVTKGVSFRDAHEVVGKAVAFCLAESKELTDLELSEFKEFSKFIEDDIYDFINVDNSINNKKSFGGTSKENVLNRISKLKNG